MFDLVFDAFSAWNQIGYMMMGIVFIAIGGGLIGYELYWRLCAQRVPARIKAVRVAGLKERVRAENESAARTTQAAHDTSNNDLEKAPLASSFGGLIGILFLGLPVIFSAFGIYKSYQYFHLVQNGAHAPAQVVRNESHYDSESGTSYKAVVQYRDNAGKRWTVTDDISYGSSLSYEQGSNVAVYYDPQNPENFVIDDFWHNMTLALIFMAVAPIFIGFFMFAASMQKRQKYAKQGIGRKAGYMGEVYYPVYEYKGSEGSYTEKVSEAGSSSLLNKQPGRRITLLRFAGQGDDKVRRPSLLLLLFGMVFLLPGLAVMYMAVTEFETNVMTYLMVLALFSFIGFKIWRKVQAVPRDQFQKGLAHYKKKGFEFKISSGPGGKNAETLTAQQLKPRLKRQAKHAKYGACACLVVAFTMLGIAYYTGQDMIERTQNGVSATGTVVDVARRYSSSSGSGGSGYMYYSVVRFTDHMGKSWRFEDSVGRSTAVHRGGETVPVLYVPHQPSRAIIDRGIMNWGLSAGLALAALIALWLALYNFQSARISRIGRI